MDRIVILLASHGYKINFKKSKIAYLNLVFLGYELSNEGKGLAPDFLQKCAALQPPNTLRQLQTLLGFLNFDRPYMPYYAEHLKPLYSLIILTFSA